MSAFLKISHIVGTDGEIYEMICAHCAKSVKIGTDIPYTKLNNLSRGSKNIVPN